MSGVIYVPLEQGSGGISSVTGIDPIQDLGNLNKQIKLKDGTAPNQVLEWSGSAWVLIPTPGGSSSISVGPTMKGDGTPSNPLDLSDIFQTLIVETASRSINNQQDINTNTNDIQNLEDNKLSEVIHDSSLTGAGTSASPLSVAGENTYSESITQAQWIDQGDGTFLYQMNHGLNTRNIVFSVRDTNTNKFVFLTEYEASTALFLEITNTERVDVTVSIIAADNNFLLI